MQRRTDIVGLGATVLSHKERLSLCARIEQSDRAIDKCKEENISERPHRNLRQRLVLDFFAGLRYMLSAPRWSFKVFNRTSIEKCLMA